MADGLPARTRALNAVGPRDLGRENAVLRELVTVYRHLSGLALQNPDIGSLTRLLAERTDATVAVVSEVMDVLAAGAPGITPEEAAEAVREQVVHPRLGQVLRASRQSHRALRLPAGYATTSSKACCSAAAARRARRSAGRRTSAIARPGRTASW